MDDINLLVKTILLLYRESKLAIDTKEYSTDLIKTVLEFVKVPENIIFGNKEKEIITKLKAMVINLCNHITEAEPDKSTILTDLSLILNEEEDYKKLYTTLLESINEEMVDSSLKKSVTAIRKSLTMYYKDRSIQKIISTASFDINNKRDKIKIGEFVDTLITQLESYRENTLVNDPAVVSVLDIGNPTELSTVFDKINKVNEKGGMIFRTGWQGLNRITGEGLRRGDFVFFPALQHKYKSGTTLSVFAQMAMFNTPILKDPTKKPLLLRISLEDNEGDYISFLYNYLKYDEHHFLDKNDGASNEEKATYVKEKLTSTGFHMKFMRVDPSLWTYRDLFNTVIELESQGYEVQILMVDYLSLLPTTGCDTRGPTGTDMRDLFRRVRNFCGAKDILFISPHQMSTEAKMVLRNEVNEVYFLNNIAEKGYYSGSKQLDQEIDLEIYIHLFKSNKETYLAFRRGKMRRPIQVEENFFIMKFPKGAPIPSDLNKEDSSMSKLPAAKTDEELFKFS